MSGISKGIEGRFVVGSLVPVEDVSKKRKHIGYDLIAEQNGVLLKIEVKGCSHLWGIPDPYLTEFDASRRLIADFLYVVYFHRPQEASDLHHPS